MAPEGAQKARLRRLAADLSALAARSLDPWLAVGLDPQGGAYGFLDRYFQPRFFEDDGRCGASQERRGDQSLVQQARHLFSYSLMESRRPGDSRVAEFAHRMYRHLTGPFVRRRNDGRGSIPPGSTTPRPFLHWTPRGGGVGGVGALAAEILQRDEHEFPVPEAGRDYDVQEPGSPFATQLYAQAFAVYGLATYALTFDVPQAATWARSLFLSLDAERHDGEYGGYDQRRDGGWLSFVSAPEGAAKCTNTHIHLLEALTPLALAFPGDEKILARLTELTRLIATRLFQPSGYVHKFFAPDWTPVGPPSVSYGHDLETSWLLLDALEAIKSSGKVDADFEETVCAASREMARHALDHGWDEAGGVYDDGVPRGGIEPPRVTNFEKVWWAQAEALPGMYRLYQACPSDELLDKIERTFAFLSQKSWDAEGGEFFWGVDSDGRVAGRGDHKGEMWKTPYHALRACLITADWIRADLGGD